MELKFAMMILCFVIALTVHELGHYLAGVMFNAKIKSFNILASPGFHVFSTHDKWFLRFFPSMSKRIEVRIGWLPLLAYVRFEDKPSKENTDKSFLHNKPAWQRLIIFSAGVMMNLFLAVMVEFFLFWHYNPQERNPITLAGWATEYVIEMSSTMTLSMVEDMTEKIKNVLPLKDKNKAEKYYEPSNKQISVVKDKGDYYRLASHFPENVLLPRLAFLLVWIDIGIFLFNLLPIPPLDGGQILFSVYELIVQRPPNERFRITVTLLGTLFVLGLILYSIFYEIVKDLF